MSGHEPAGRYSFVNPSSSCGLIVARMVATCSRKGQSCFAEGLFLKRLRKSSFTAANCAALRVFTTGPDTPGSILSSGVTDERLRADEVSASPAAGKTGGWRASRYPATAAEMQAVEILISDLFTGVGSFPFENIRNSLRMCGFAIQPFCGSFGILAFPFRHQGDPNRFSDVLVDFF